MKKLINFLLEENTNETMKKIIDDLLWIVKRYGHRLDVDDQVMVNSQDFNIDRVYGLLSIAAEINSPRGGELGGATTERILSNAVEFLKVSGDGRKIHVRGFTSPLQLKNNI